MEWTKRVEEVDGLTVHSWRGISNGTTLVIAEEALSGDPLVKTGEVNVYASNYRTCRDVLRTVKVKADPGEDPCATARSKAEEFVELFAL